MPSTPFQPSIHNTLHLDLAKVAEEVAWITTRVPFLKIQGESMVHSQPGGKLRVQGKTQEVDGSMVSKSMGYLEPTYKWGIYIYIYIGETKNPLIQTIYEVLGTSK